jgi:GT2 family glycosyltransferase
MCRRGARNVEDSGRYSDAFVGDSDRATATQATPTAVDQGTDRRQLAAAQAKLREHERTISSLASGIDQIQRDLERVAASRAWRWGHALSMLGWRLRRRQRMTQGAVERALARVEQIKRSTPGLPASEQPRELAPAPLMPTYDVAAVLRAEHGPRRAELARELRARLGATQVAERWPPVSVVALTHDGHERLERLLDGLRRHTDYPALELVLVDNGSVRPIANPVEAGGGIASAVGIRNEHNRPFADANNQAAAAASGEILLFVNDDVELFEPGWLKELVAAVLCDRVGAAGATLLHVAHDPELTASGWIVQHRGIRFRLEDQLARAFNDGDGEDLFGAGFGEELGCPAVTAACLAIRREAFEQVGGFSSGYRFGTEDVDLGLKLLTAGWDVRCCGRAVAFHRESVTQATVPRAEIADNRRVNRQLFNERWGAPLRRELRRARLTGDSYWTTEPAHFAITVSSLDRDEGWGDWYTARELGSALEALGTRVTYLPRKGAAEYPPPADLDALVALMDSFDLAPLHPAVTIFAWVRNWAHRWTERPWFSRVDRVLASSAGSASVLREVAGMSSVRFPLATNPERFHELPAERIYDYVLTANRWGVERQIESALAPRDSERVAIFGKGWEGIGAAVDHWRGPISYDRLPGIYSAARIVLDDTAGPTLPYGALNARVFDALACGSLVLTNCEAGAHELFDPDFPVWSNAEDLREHLDQLLANEPRRSELVAHYRRTVLAEHTYDHRARELLTLAREQLRELSFVIRIGAPDWERAERWGDLYFARAIEQELRRRGHRCLVQVLEEWDQPEGNCYDVSIVLRGRSHHRPKAGQLNVLWAISHPDELTAAECDDYDLVAVASASHTAALGRRTRTPVFVLEQATDARRFWPEPDPAVAHDIVFVGNSRGVRRQALDWLLPTDLDLAVWGGDWNGLIDTRYVRGEFIANEELRRVYSSAKIVLADHWPDMRDNGYISNRVYDALASGAMVLSDPVSGLEERFGDSVAVYRSPEELRSQIVLLLGDEEGRRARARKGREIVVDAHTFERRVDVLLEQVETRWEELGRRHGIRGSPGA